MHHTSIKMYLLFLLVSTMAVFGQANDSNVEQLFETGVIQYRNQNYEQAFDTFQKITGTPEENPRKTIALLMGARSAYELQNYKLAENFAERLFRKYPQSKYLSDAYLVHANIQLKQGNQAEALMDLAYAVENSRNNEIRNKCEMAGLDIVRNGVSVEIMKNLYSHFNWTKARPIVMLWGALALHNNGQTKKAENLLDTMLKQNPGKRYENLAQNLFSDSKKSTVVQIGVIQPLSGLFSKEAKDFIQGLAFAIHKNKDIQDRIDLIIKDTRGNTDRVVQATRELMDRDVSLIIGTLEGSQCATIAGLAGQSGIPIIVPVSTDNNLTGLGPRVFQANNTLSRRGEALADYAYNNLGLRSFAMLAPADDYGHSLTDAFTQKIDQLGGQIISQQWYYPGTQDLKRQFDAVRKAAFRYGFRDSIRTTSRRALPGQIDSLFNYHNMMSVRSSEDNEGLVANDDIPVRSIDGFFMPIYTEDIPYVIPQYALSNIKALPLGGNYWNDLDVLRNHKRYVDGAVFVSGFHFTESDPEYIKFVNDFRVTTSTTPGQMAGYGYNIMNLVIDAIENGYTQHDELVKYMKNVSGMSLLGGQITFKDHNRVNQSVNILQFKDGDIHKVAN